MGVENVTVTVDGASMVAMSAGVVLTTLGTIGVMQLPLPSHCVPPIEHSDPGAEGGFDGMPIEQMSSVH